MVFSHEKNTKEAKSIINKILETHNAPDYYLLLAEIAEYEGNEKEKNKEKKKGSHPEWEKLGFAGLILTALEKGE